MTTVFISHSWQDKSFADKLAGDLEGVAEIWLDSQQTKPGAYIADDVNQGLLGADIVLVLWSEHAAASDWVAKEIDFACSNGKAVIPLLLDTAPQTGPLEDMLGIRVADWKTNYAKCFMRINFAIAKVQSQKLAAAGVDLDIDALLEKLDDVDGVTNYISDYRQEHGVSGNAGQWIQRILTATQAAHEQGSAYLGSLEEGAEYARSLAERIGDSLHDPAALRGILDELIEHQHRSPLMGNMRAMVEQALSSFSEQTASPVPDAEAAEQPDPASAVPETAGAHHIREQIRAAIEREQETHRLESRLQRVFAEYGIATNAQMLAEARGHVIDYVSHVPELLDALAAAAAAGGKSAEVQPLLDLVSDYFHDGDDLLPDELGVFGLVDDAYLAFSAIQNINERCEAASGRRLIEDDLHGANKMIELLLGPEIVAALKQKLAVETERNANWETWKTLGKVALGGLAAYGLLRVLSNAAGGSAQSASAGAGASWGDSFEAQVSQFFAENGYSTPDWY